MERRSIGPVDVVFGFEGDALVIRVEANGATVAEYTVDTEEGVDGALRAIEEVAAAFAAPPPVSPAPEAPTAPSEDDFGGAVEAPVSQPAPTIQPESSEKAASTATAATVAPETAVAAEPLSDGAALLEELLSGATQAEKKVKTVLDAITEPKVPMTVMVYSPTDKEAKVDAFYGTFTGWRSEIDLRGRRIFTFSYRTSHGRQSEVSIPAFATLYAIKGLRSIEIAEGMLMGKSISEFFRIASRDHKKGLVTFGRPGEAAGSSVKIEDPFASLECPEKVKAAASALIRAESFRFSLVSAAATAEAHDAPREMLSNMRDNLAAVTVDVVRNGSDWAVVVRLPGNDSKVFFATGGNQASAPTWDRVASYGLRKQYAQRTMASILGALPGMIRKAHMAEGHVYSAVEKGALLDAAEESSRSIGSSGDVRVALRIDLRDVPLIPFGPNAGNGDALDVEEYAEIPIFFATKITPLQLAQIRATIAKIASRLKVMLAAAVAYIRPKTEGTKIGWMRHESLYVDHDGIFRVRAEVHAALTALGIEEKVFIALGFGRDSDQTGFRELKDYYPLLKTGGSVHGFKPFALRLNALSVRVGDAVFPYDLNDDGTPLIGTPVIARLPPLHVFSVSELVYVVEEKTYGRVTEVMPRPVGMAPENRRYVVTVRGTDRTYTATEIIQKAPTLPETVDVDGQPMEVETIVDQLRGRGYTHRQEDADRALAGAEALIALGGENADFISFFLDDFSRTERGGAAMQRRDAARKREEAKIIAAPSPELPAQAAVDAYVSEVSTAVAEDDELSDSDFPSRIDVIIEELINSIDLRCGSFVVVNSSVELEASGAVKWSATMVGDEVPEDHNPAERMYEDGESVRSAVPRIGGEVVRWHGSVRRFKNRRKDFILYPDGEDRIHVKISIEWSHTGGVVATWQESQSELRSLLASAVTARLNLPAKSDSASLPAVTEPPKYLPGAAELIAKATEERLAKEAADKALADQQEKTRADAEATRVKMEAESAARQAAPVLFDGKTIAELEKLQLIGVAGKWTELDRALLVDVAQGKVPNSHELNALRSALDRRMADHVRSSGEYKAAVKAFEDAQEDIKTVGELFRSGKASRDDYDAAIEAKAVAEKAIGVKREELMRELERTVGGGYAWHYKPTGFSGPCPVCECPLKGLKAEHYRKSDRVWKKKVSTGIYVKDSEVVTIKLSDDGKAVTCDGKTTEPLKGK